MAMTHGYSKHDVAEQVRHRERRMALEHNDWHASVEDLQFEHKFLGSAIPFSADARPVS